MELESFLGEFTHRDWRTDTEGTLRFALIGVGWWTVERAIPAIESSELCETTTVVSSSEEKAEDAAGEAEAIEHAITYEQFHDGAAADAYDAVYIATPNALHLEYAETAAELEKAVLCEKPMEAAVERAEAMIEACSEIPLMVAYRMHTQPAVRRAKELLQGGIIGEPVQVYGNNSQVLMDIFEDPDQWRLDPDLSGYGTSVMDLGIYPINTARFLLESDPVEVTAQMGSYGDAFDDVPDERAAFTMGFENGVHAACTTSQHAHDDSQLKITGTEGQLDLYPAFHGEAELSVARGESTAEVTFGEVDEMEEEFEYFADRVHSGEALYADGKHGLTDMRVMEAIYEAGEEGGVVEIG